MLRRLYILALWTATLSVLLLTGVAHHHHAEQICFVEEQCSRDGNINDSHTAHHANDAEDCEVHQLYRFIGNAGAAQSIQQHIADGLSLAAIAANATIDVQLFPVFLTIVRGQVGTPHLAAVLLYHDGRRGPPTPSFS